MAWQFALPLLSIEAGFTQIFPGTGHGSASMNASILAWAHNYNQNNEYVNFSPGQWRGTIYVYKYVTSSPPMLLSNNMLIKRIPMLDDDGFVYLMANGMLLNSLIAYLYTPWNLGTKYQFSWDNTAATG